jgi:hypothetical protein
MTIYFYCIYVHNYAAFFIYSVRLMGSNINFMNIYCTSECSYFYLFEKIDNVKTEMDAKFKGTVA